MKLLKLFGKNKDKIFNILLILGVVVLAGILFRYNSEKGLLSDGMSGNPFSGVSEVSSGEGAVSEESQPAQVEGAVPVGSTDDAQYLKVSGIKSGKADSKSCNEQPMMDPKELLPTDKNNEWSNIMPNNDLKNIHMINAGHHVGINTVGSSLRNANLQIRSEPVIPQGNVGPWNQTTIEADNMRRGFEIGSSE
tara:strand:+ start:903 stop:1481 length:579 start_codon:yes stop_codon:yes gene_type:complete